MGTDLMTAVRPGAKAPGPAGLVHDGGAWADPSDVSRYAPPRERVPHAVHVGLDPWKPSDAELREFTSEEPDGLGGFLRRPPQTREDQALDDHHLLNGEELYRLIDASDPGSFDVVPLEDENEARRRRTRAKRLLEDVA